MSTPTRLASAGITKSFNYSLNPAHCANEIPSKANVASITPSTTAYATSSSHTTMPNRQILYSLSRRT